MTVSKTTIWQQHVPVPGTPEGFTVRTTFPANPNGVEVMLEQWKAGSEEPPHSHPGDDMTVVIEGKMSIQYYIKESGKLVPEGNRIILSRGDTGYVQAGRIHDAKYLEDCKLVYVHDKGFAFIAHG